MYIRFETYWRDADARQPTGIFQAAAFVRDTGTEHCEPWCRREILLELEWFCHHLEAPERFFYRPGSYAARSGICWFKPAAVEHITRGRYLGWLIAEAGLATTERRSAHPGRMVWEDNRQAVFLAEH